MQTAKDANTSDWLAIGHLDDIPVLGARVVETPHGPVAVFRNSADEVYALLDRCPHRGGPLSEGMVHGRLVTCPLHAWNIHLDQGEAKAPDKGCVPRFEVHRDGDRLYLDPNPVG
ncbi:nitrite reductase (NADH) small subunit [Natronocella acetinitrilica]|uniref:Nitrite reductase (NADH) small subunit n=1 Tax=Natronocella acetinitrilica TaxID=414046 RepID=A0AAE3G490_9GAMM|nr:nitrite reductase small subunit NirD [Natronocella acetinitrilica]MCP1675339.1 nitrite reductase (NADH) small subunit [Natronocella acetinitrilica]